MLMLYLAGMQMKWICIARAGAAPVMYYMLFHVPFRRARMMVFLNPEADPKGAGFHILQSLIAVGTGGIRGLGLMEGVQKLFFLPEPHTDFIFANICEELGLIGALCVVAAVLRPRLPRAARGVSLDRSLRALSGLRPDDRHPGAGVLQHQRGACAAADQGHPAAVHLVRRDERLRHAGVHGRAAERDPRD